MKKFTDIFIPFHFDDLVGGREFEQAMKLCLSTMAITLLILKILDCIEESLASVTEVTIPYFVSSSIAAILGCILAYYFVIGMLWMLVEAVRKALADIKSMNQAKEISASETSLETNADCLQISPDVPIDAELESKPEVLHTKEDLDHLEEKCMFGDIFSPQLNEEAFIVFLEDNKKFLKKGAGLALLYMLVKDRNLIKSNCNMFKFHSYVSRKISCVKYCQFSQKVLDSNIDLEASNTSEAKEYQCLLSQLDRILV